MQRHAEDKKNSQNNEVPIRYVLVDEFVQNNLKNIHQESKIDKNAFVKNECETFLVCYLEKYLNQSISDAAELRVVAKNAYGAKLAYKTGAFSLVLKLLRNVLDQCPEDNDSRILLVKTFIQLNNSSFFSLAVGEILYLMQDDSSNPEYFFLHGEICIKMNDHPTARKQFLEGIIYDTFSSNEPIDHSVRLKILNYLKKPIEFIADEKKSENINIDSLLMDGKSKMLHPKNYPQALDCFTKVIESHTETQDYLKILEAWSQRALVFNRLNKRQEAIEDFSISMWIKRYFISKHSKDKLLSLSWIEQFRDLVLMSYGLITAFPIHLLLLTQAVPSQRKSLNHSFSDTLATEAKSLITKELYEKAKTFITQALTLNPKNESAKLLLSLIPEYKPISSTGEIKAESVSIKLKKKKKVKINKVVNFVRIKKSKYNPSIFKELVEKEEKQLLELRTITLKQERQDEVKKIPKKIKPKKTRSRIIISTQEQTDTQEDIKLTPEIKEEKIFSDILKCSRIATIKIENYEKEILNKLECNSAHVALITGGAIRSRVRDYLFPKSNIDDPCHDLDIVTTAPEDIILSLGAIKKNNKGLYGLEIVDEKKSITKVDIWRTQYKTIRDDLINRDFTINAFISNKQGHVRDHCGGVFDLKDNILKTTKDSDISLKDDPLRILRAFDFIERLQTKATIELKHAINKNAYLLGKMEDKSGVHSWLKYHLATTHIASENSRNNFDLLLRTQQEQKDFILNQGNLWENLFDADCAECLKKDRIWILSELNKNNINLSTIYMMILVSLIENNAIKTTKEALERFSLLKDHFASSVNVQFYESVKLTRKQFYSNHLVIVTTNKSRSL